MYPFRRSYDLVDIVFSGNVIWCECAIETKGLVDFKYGGNNGRESTIPPQISGVPGFPAVIPSVGLSH